MFTGVTHRVVDADGILRISQNKSNKYKTNYETNYAMHTVIVTRNTRMKVKKCDITNLLIANRLVRSSKLEHSL